MSATVAPLSFQPPKVPEDEARSGYYALLARLFYAGPDAQLLEAIGGTEEMVADSGELAGAWNALAAAARAMDSAAARLEYDEVFVGTGKAEVTPYASFYLSETGREKILVRLQQDLVSLGLGRSGAVREPEDHMASLLEVMRHLISTGSDDAALQKQRDFFSRYLERSFEPFCSAISNSAKTNFYKRVGGFAKAFLEVESEGLKVF